MVCLTKPRRAMKARTTFSQCRSSFPQQFSAAVFLILFVVGTLLLLSSQPAFAQDPCEGCDGPTEDKVKPVIPDCCPGCEVRVHYLITHCSERHKKIWINYFEIDTNDPDCQAFWSWITDTIANWKQFMQEAFYKISISEMHVASTHGVGVNCNDQFFTTRIYWKACVDLTSIEVVNRPIVWCKFGNCCMEEYVLCLEPDGFTPRVIDHRIVRLTNDRCKEEPGRFCVPAMCD